MKKILPTHRFILLFLCLTLIVSRYTSGMTIPVTSGKSALAAQTVKKEEIKDKKPEEKVIQPPQTLASNYNPPRVYTTPTRTPQPAAVPVVSRSYSQPVVSTSAPAAISTSQNTSTNQPTPTSAPAQPTSTPAPVVEQPHSASSPRSDSGQAGQAENKGQEKREEKQQERQERREEKGNGKKE